jgi:hypothetical protein
MSTSMKNRHKIIALIVMLVVALLPAAVQYAAAASADVSMSECCPDSGACGEDDGRALTSCALVCFNVFGFVEVIFDLSSSAFAIEPSLVQAAFRQSTDSTPFTPPRV